MYPQSETNYQPSTFGACDEVIIYPTDVIYSDGLYYVDIVFDKSTKGIPQIQCYSSTNELMNINYKIHNDQNLITVYTGTNDFDYITVKLTYTSIDSWNQTRLELFAQPIHDITSEDVGYRVAVGKQKFPTFNVDFGTIASYLQERQLGDFLSENAHLIDINNKQIARNNISVYSKSENDYNILQKGDYNNIYYLCKPDMVVSPIDETQGGTVDGVRIATHKIIKDKLQNTIITTLVPKEMTNCQYVIKDSVADDYYRAYTYVIQYRSFNYNKIRVIKESDGIYRVIIHLDIALERFHYSPVLREFSINLGKMNDLGDIATSTDWLAMIDKVFPMMYVGRIFNDDFTYSGEYSIPDSYVDSYPWDSKQLTINGTRHWNLYTSFLRDYSNYNPNLYDKKELRGTLSRGNDIQGYNYAEKYISSSGTTVKDEREKWDKLTEKAYWYITTDYSGNLLIKGSGNLLIPKGYFPNTGVNDDFYNNEFIIDKEFLINTNN